MSFRVVCDGCGKVGSSVTGDANLTSWSCRPSPRRTLTLHACPDCNVDKVDLPYDQATSAPPSSTSLRNPGELLGPVATSFIAGLAGSMFGHALATTPSSGWRRPGRKGDAHYFVAGDSLCGAWLNYRGMVQAKAPLNRVCATCKAKAPR